MKKIVRLFSALMAMMLLLSITATLSSCNKDKKDPAETTETVNTSTSDDQLEALLIKDMDGRTFKMLWPEYLPADGHFAHNELAVADGANGDMIDQAVFTRTESVKLAYNAEIEVETMKYSAIDDTIRNDHALGEQAYDAVATVIAQMSTVAIEGVLKDFNDMEYYDESQSWWNHDVMQSLSIANNRYFGSGDIIYSDDLYPYVIYANTAMATSLGITDNFYELVKNKEWTLEQFHEFAAQATADIDGTPGLSSGDRFGAVDGTSFARALYYTAGKGVISLDKAGYPRWEMSIAHGDDVLGKIIDALHVDDAVVDVAVHLGMSGTKAMDIMNMFNTNQMLFMPGDLKAAQAFTSMDNALEDFALLPMPLWDSNSEYICVMNDAVVLSVPTLATGLDDVSLILSAMSRASVETLTPAFFETVLTYRYMKNAESVETLRLILDSVVPRDVADIQGWGGFMNEFSKMAVEGRSEFASYYDGNYSAAMGKLDEYIDLLLAVK